LWKAEKDTRFWFDRGKFSLPTRGALETCYENCLKHTFSWEAEPLKAQHPTHSAGAAVAAAAAAVVVVVVVVAAVLWKVPPLYVAEYKSVEDFRTQRTLPLVLGTKICALSFLCAFAHTVKCDVNRILK
jgi:hypothetical protein